MEFPALLLWKVERTYFMVIGCSDFIWWDDSAKIIFLSKSDANENLADVRIHQFPVTVP